MASRLAQGHPPHLSSPGCNRKRTSPSDEAERVGYSAHAAERTTHPTQRTTRQTTLDSWSRVPSVSGNTASSQPPPAKRQPPPYMADGRPNTSGPGGWSRALTRIASLPSNQLRVGPLNDGNVCLYVDEWTVAIADGFPKAKYHVLILPRIPFRCASGETLDANTLDRLSSLLRSPMAGEVLDKVQDTAQRVQRIIEAHMPLAKRDASPTNPMDLVCIANALASSSCIESPNRLANRAGTTWPIWMAFHSVPSMHTLHLHMYSSDLVSDRLKRPHHYLSFSPLTGFALPLAQVVQWAHEGPERRSRLPLSDKEYETLTRTATHGGLPSLYDSTELLPTLPAMKAHLLQRWLQSLDQRPKQGPSDSRPVDRAQRAP